MTDAELIAGLRARDSTALALLVSTFATPVYRLVHRLLAEIGNEQDVEECASDVFHAAWLRIEQVDPARAPLKTWLLVLARYQALEQRRTLLRRAGLGAAGQTYLSGFDFEAKPDRGQISSTEARMDEVTGQVQWIEFP